MMVIVLMSFGWPAVLVSLVLTVMGISTKRSSFVIWGAIVGCPFLMYLFLTPRFRVVAIPVGVLYFAAAWAVARNHRLAAVALFTPFVGLVTFLMWLVINQ